MKSFAGFKNPERSGLVKAIGILLITTSLLSFGEELIRLRGCLMLTKSRSHQKNEVREIVSNYFKDIFSDKGALGILSNQPKLFLGIQSQGLIRLNSSISSEELRTTCFLQGSSKPQGQILCLPSSTCFYSGVIPPILNDTFLALVPKMSNPTAMNQIRPINLCNILYKVISKVLVSRLRPLLHQLINLTQASFYSWQADP